MVKIEDDPMPNLRTPVLETKPDGPRRHAPARPISGRWFYSGTGALFLALTLVGFYRYYLQGKASSGRDIAPSVQSLILMHATVMTTWIVLFLVQPLLIANRNHRIHMAVGRFGAVLAACVIILGWWVGIQTTRLKPPELLLWGVTPKQFMVVPVLTSLIFGVFVGLGVYYRRRPDIHRPMMLMATLIAMPAPVSRIGPLNAIYDGTPLQSIFGPFLWTLVLATVLLVVKSLTSRRLDRWFAIGYGGLVASCLLVWQFGMTDAWGCLATLLV
jgi:hypothetical protein